MFSFKYVLSVFLLYNLGLFHLIDGRISNERKCVDETCSVPISLAKTLIRYNSDDERILSFQRNAQVKVFSKEAGDRKQFWGVEIKGKRGYVPKEFLRETKLLVKKEDVKVIVSTGRDDGKLNATQDSFDKPSTTSPEHVVTPALPTGSSKGFFGIMGGVSADSVPPNSPDIKPQATDPFQVFDGTTIYEEPAPDTAETVVSNPEKVPSSKPPSLKDSKFDDKPPVANTLSFKESIDAIQKPPISQIKHTLRKETPSDGAADAISEQKEVLLESIPDVKEIHIEKSVEEGESLTANPVVTKENNDEDFSSSVETSTEVGTEEKAEELDKFEAKETVDDQVISNDDVNNKDELKTSGSEPSSIFGGILDQVTNYISSGTGEILENNSDEEKEADEEVVRQHVDGNIEQESSGEFTQGENDVSISDQAELSNKIDEPKLLEGDASSAELKQSDDTTKAPKLQEIVKMDNVEQTTDDPDQKKETFNKALDVEGNSEASSSQEKEDIKKLPLTVDEKEYNPLNKSVLGLDIDTTTMKDSTFSSKPAGVSDKNEVVGNSNSQLKIEQMALELNQPVNINPLLASHREKEDPITHTSSEFLAKEEETPKQIISESVVSVTSSESVVTSPFSGQTFRSIDENKLGSTKVKSESVYDIKPVYEEPEPPHPSLDVDSKIVSHSSSDSSKVEEVSHILPASKETPHLPTTYSQDTHKPPPVPPFFKERNTLPKHEDKPIYSAVAKDETIESEEEKKETQQSETTISGDVQFPVSDTEDTLEKSKEETTLPETFTLTEEPNFESTAEHGNTHEPLDEFVTEEKLEDTTTEPEASEGLFSWLNPILDLFSSSETSKEDLTTQTSDDPSLFSNKVDSILPPGVQEGSCQADGFGEEACGALKPVTDPVDEAAGDTSWHQLIFFTDSVPATLELVEKIPLEVTVWLIVTAVVVLIFSLGHYYIEAHRRDGPLVAVINKLEREVLILRKESSILDDRLHTAQEQLEAWTTNSSENDALLIELRQELEDTKTAKVELEEQVAVLEKEVETVTESGLEMHRLLSESLSSQDGSQVLLSTVETLREKLEHQENEICGLSQSLASKNTEVDELKDKLEEAAEVAVELENKIISLTREKEEAVLEQNDKHRQLLAQLEEVLETKALDETRVSTEMSKLRLSVEELQKLLGEKDSELEQVKEVVKQLRSTDSNEKMDALFDVVTVKAQLKAASSERDDFREKFLEEEGARKLLEGHMKKITQEVAELKNSFETAEKEKIEALTRLQVLSDYFKEKEGELQKELGLKESMWLQKQSEDHTIYEQMRSLREENEKYKLQNESLKKEIVEQESSFKIQLANVEQKSHENWVASRQAERRLKEVQQEAAQLRNRLTMEKSANNFSSLDDSKQMNESNGDPSSPPSSLIFPPTTSPPFMMYPPGDFVPPPPLLGSPYPSDSRPPPLGRISSPPLDHRFSPPPPYPPYEPYPHYGHHSPSPPPPLPPYTHHRNVHKPQPREMSRDPKDHSMSNYSPETEKPSRRNKR